MNRPLEKALFDFSAKSDSRFFMPGHKGTAYADFLPALSLDVTELEMTGNLYDNLGVIADSEREAAAVAGVPALLYSAGGSTLCIQALFAEFFRENDRILLPRASHKAAIHAMGLLRMEPVWIASSPGLCGRIDMDSMIAKIRGGEADGVFVTSPDYFGQTVDIPVLSAACKEADIPLIVDAAHGGHFPLLGLDNPVTQGADGCAVSLHKTLPALTGAAAVYLADPSRADSVRRRMSVFGSSSPSFLITLSVERCYDYMQTAAAEWRALADTCAALRVAAGNLLMPPVDDPTRLVYNLAGLDESKVAQIAEENHITCELLDARCAILIPSPLNTAGDFARLSAFTAALGSLPRHPAVFPDPPFAPRALSLRQALLAESESLPIGQAAGRICAETVSRCPPATVLVAPGEIIQRELADFLFGTGILSVNVIK